MALGNSKAPDTRPARARYWAKDTLRKRRIANMMRVNKMSEANAMQVWRNSKASLRGRKR